MKKRPGLEDLTALALLMMSKIGRDRHHGADDGEGKRFYNQFFAKKDFSAYLRDPRMKVRRKTLADFFRFAVPPGASVLDVGCGLGDVISGLPGGYHLRGIDLSRGNCMAAQARPGDEKYICQASIGNIPFGPETMDAALCLEVLEHIEDDASAIREIHRVLKPSAYLVTAVPYTYYWKSYLKLMGHYRHYTRRSFAAFLEDNGFKVEFYLPNYARWHQTFSRRYACIRALSMTLGRTWGKGDVFEFHIPGFTQSVIDALEEMMLNLQEEERNGLFATEQTSTFLAARKVCA